MLTVTDADPAEAISAAEMTAVSCVELTNVVGRAELFQFTTDALTKFAPFTVRVNPEVLQDGVEFEEVVEDDKEAIVGGTIVNGSEAREASPPGPRFDRETWAV